MITRVAHPLPRMVADQLPPGPVHAADLSAALSFALADRAALRDWLAALLADPAIVAAIVMDSYWHKNGFAKFVLYRDERFSLRLHVWPPGADRLGESDPHAHRWCFASTVLVGTGLEVVEYAEHDKGRSYQRYDYDGSRLVASGPATLLAMHEHVIPRSKRYTTAIETVHTVKPMGSDLLATLVLQGRRQSDATAVYGTLDAPMDDTRRPVDESDVRRLIAQVLDTLERPGGETP